MLSKLNIWNGNVILEILKSKTSQPAHNNQRTGADTSAVIKRCLIQSAAQCPLPDNLERWAHPCHCHVPIARNWFNIDLVRKLFSTLLPVPTAIGYCPSFFYHRITKPNCIQLMRLIWKMFSLSVLISPTARVSSGFLWIYQDMKSKRWFMHPMSFFNLFMIYWITTRKWCPGPPNPSSHKQHHHATLSIKQNPTTLYTHCSDT